MPPVRAWSMLKRMGARPGECGEEGRLHHDGACRAEPLQRRVIREDCLLFFRAELSASCPEFRVAASQSQDKADAGDVNGNAEIIKDTFHNFNIKVEMDGANVGPRVTQFTLKPPSGIKLSKIDLLLCHKYNLMCFCWLPLCYIIGAFPHPFV